MRRQCTHRPHQRFGYLQADGNAGSGGSFDLWFVDNRPAPGHTTFGRAARCVAARGLLLSWRPSRSPQTVAYASPGTLFRFLAGPRLRGGFGPNPVRPPLP